jgi:hypothetical protein
LTQSGPLARKFRARNGADGLWNGDGSVALSELLRSGHLGDAASSLATSRRNLCRAANPVRQ